jgi:hypothetical protein
VDDVSELRVEIVVVNPRTGARSEAITALADTGATLSVIPQPVLERLGVETLRRVSLLLADGRRAQRQIGDAAIAPPPAPASGRTGYFLATRTSRGASRSKGRPSRPPKTATADQRSGRSMR